MSTMTCYIDALSTTSPEDKEEVYDFADEPDTFYKKRYIIGLTYSIRSFVSITVGFHFNLLSTL